MAAKASDQRQCCTAKNSRARPITAGKWHNRSGSARSRLTCCNGRGRGRQRDPSAAEPRCNRDGARTGPFRAAQPRRTRHRYAAHTRQEVHGTGSRPRAAGRQPEDHLRPGADRGSLAAGTEPGHRRPDGGDRRRAHHRHEAARARIHGGRGAGADHRSAADFGSPRDRGSDRPGPQDGRVRGRRA